jgi:4'-phosphopantetheinyl transferase
LQASKAIVATVWLFDGRTVGDQELLPRLDWLNAAETERYRRFVRPERQRQFLIGRILLRLALGELLGVQPRTISLTERPNQAPLLNWPLPAPGFSLSHSGPWIACAVSAQTALGLDIEVMNPDRDLVALSEQAFDADDTATVEALQGDAKVTMFYRLWSKKEARYKLVSGAGRFAVDSYHVLAHPDISIVLCSEYPLDSTSLHEIGDWPI